MAKLLVWMLLLVLPVATAFAAPQLHGVVQDMSGARLRNAHVIVICGSEQQMLETGDDGLFSVSVLKLPFTLRVVHAGFADYARSFSSVPDQTVTVTMREATASKQIVVTATRTPLPADETGAAVDVLSERDLETSGGVLLSDRLRELVGFSSFRRTSSISDNPTSEGVSLRGVGSNGSSRALVLLDGVPISDPFGGWIYWDQVPEVSVDSVEVLRGGASGLYGSDAMGGVVNLITRRPEGIVADVQGAMGNAFLRNGEAYLGGTDRNWSGSLSGQALADNGFYVVSREQRGDADSKATLDFRNGNADAERTFNGGRAFLSGALLAETRNNGTRLQVNDTHLGRLTAGVDLSPASAGTLSLKAYLAGERFHQTFSSISTDRNTESLTDIQSAPSEDFGGSAQWARNVGRYALSAGGDFATHRGHTEDTSVSSGQYTSLVDAGGSELFYGFFVEALVPIGRKLALTSSLRGDLWSNLQGHSNTTPLSPTAPPAHSTFPNRDEFSISPRIAALYSLRDGLALTGAFYRAFRAPTLNELYRNFRLGNVFTEANAALTAEQLNGGEGGIRVTTHGVVMRAVFFANGISQPVANVTLITTPTLITRQRQNLGSTRSIGLESEVAWQSRRLSISGGYQFTSAIVTSFSANPALVGLWVQEIPRHQFTAQAGYTLPRWTMALQVRAAGTQFDDDQNQLPLAPYFSMDIYAGHELSRNLEAFLAGENVTGVRAQVSRTPIATLGPPALVRAGIRWHLGQNKVAVAP